MRVFVAGATGAIGRPVVECLLAPGHEATGMTRSPERAEALRRRSLTCALCARFVPGHHLEGRRRGADAPSTVTHLALIHAAILTARVALGGTAVAVVACCVHVKHVHVAPVRLAESALFALALAGAIATGALVPDLTLAVLVDLAVLLAVVAPTVAMSVRE